MHRQLKHHQSGYVRLLSREFLLELHIAVPLSSPDLWHCVYCAVTGHHRTHATQPATLFDGDVNVALRHAKPHWTIGLKQIKTMTNMFQYVYQ